MIGNQSSFSYCLFHFRVYAWARDLMVLWDTWLTRELALLHGDEGYCISLESDSENREQFFHWIRFEGFIFSSSLPLSQISSVGLNAGSLPSDRLRWCWPPLEFKRNWSWSLFESLMYLRDIGIKYYLEYSMVNINLDSLHELQPPMLNGVVLLFATYFFKHLISPVHILLSCYCTPKLRITGHASKFHMCDLGN